MARKSMKDAAMAGTSVFDQIARGTSNTQDTNNVQYVQNVSGVSNAETEQDVNKDGIPITRLNLKIPVELREYLTIAAARTSIEQRRTVSLTEYLCMLVREDMKKHTS